MQMEAGSTNSFAPGFACWWETGSPCIQYLHQGWGRVLAGFEVGSPSPLIHQQLKILQSTGLFQINEHLSSPDSVATALQLLPRLKLGRGIGDWKCRVTLTIPGKMKTLGSHVLISTSESTQAPRSHRSWGWWPPKKSRNWTSGCLGVVVTPSKGWADFPLNSVLSTLKPERTRKASAFGALKFGLCEVRDDSLKRQWSPCHWRIW